MKLLKNCTTIMLAIILSAQAIPIFASSDTGQSGTTARVNTNGINDLTVTQATRRAVDNSSSIRNTQDNITLTREQEQRLRDDLFSGNYNMVTFMNTSSMLMQAELQRAFSLDSIEAQRDTIGFIVANHFSNIIMAEKALEIYDSNIDMAEREIEILRVKVELGIESQVAYDLAVLNMKRSLNNRANLVNSINESYRELNRIMGVPLDRKYNLIFDVEYEELGNIDLTRHINNYKRNSINVRQAQNTLSVAQFQLDNHMTPINMQTGEVLPGGSTREERVANVNIASRGVRDARDEVENSIIATYNNIRGLEVTIQSSLLQLESMQRELEILETQLNLGKITRLEVDSIMLSIMELEESIRQQKSNHSLLVMKFKNPNILLSV